MRINRLAPQGVNFFVKIEAFNPLGSVKDRLALGVIEAAERSGDLRPGQTVIEATSGNAGIGHAMVCAAKEYPLVITMAEPFSVERRKLERFPLDLNRKGYRGSLGRANQIRFLRRQRRGGAMAKGYSKDLRVRVVSIVEEGDSAREAARLLNVGASTAIRWIERWTTTGSV